MASVKLEFDYYVIDVDEWLEERTSDAPDGLQESLDAFLETMPYGRHWTHDVDKWITAQGVEDGWQDDYVSGHFMTNASENALSGDLSIVLFSHPEYGPLAVVGGDNGGHCTWGPTVYTSNVNDGAEWLDWDEVSVWHDMPVEPQTETLPGIDTARATEHAWDIRGPYDAIDANGSFVPVKELWPDGVVTTDEESGEPVIHCPKCNAAMSIESRGI